MTFVVPSPSSSPQKKSTHNSQSCFKLEDRVSSLQASSQSLGQFLQVNFAFGMAESVSETVSGVLVPRWVMEPTSGGKSDASLWANKFDPVTNDSIGSIFEPSLWPLQLEIYSYTETEGLDPHSKKNSSF